MLRRKRGDIGFLLMIIVALVLVCGALFSFASFKGTFDTRSGDISTIVSVEEIIENYIVKTAVNIGKEAIVCTNCQKPDVKSKYQEIAERYDLKKRGISFGMNNFFGKIRNGEFEFLQDSGNYVFKIEDIFVEVEKGENKIRRDFSLVINFDNNGMMKEISIIRG